MTHWAIDGILIVGVISGYESASLRYERRGRPQAVHFDRPEVAVVLQNGFGSSTRFSRTTAIARVAKPLDQTQDEITHLRLYLLTRVTNPPLRRTVP